MKKTLKISGIVLGSILLLILIINIGFSLWLKYQLPDYLKNKTPYQISYKSLNVEILSGSITASDIKVSSKQPNDVSSIAIDGKLGNLNISRLGIIQFLKNNRIEASTIKLSKPDLSIRLATPKDNTAKNKQLPFSIDNIVIEDGNINISNAANQKLFSAKNLNLNVKNINLNYNPDALPFSLDSYSVTAKDFYFQLGRIYSVTASVLETKDGKLDVSDFEIKSLIDFKDWEQNHKGQKSLFGIKSKNLSFDQLVFGNTKLALKDARILNPEFTIQNRESQVVRKSKSKTGFDLDFQNVDIVNGRLSILNSAGKKTMTIAKLDANIQQFVMDAETSKSKIPFTYQDFKVTGAQLFYDAGKYYTMTLSSFSLLPKDIDLQQFKLNPKYSRSEFIKIIPKEEDLYDIAAGRIQASGINWKYEGKQPDVAMKRLTLNQVDANIFRSKIPKDNPKEKVLYSKLLRNIKFPLLIENLNLTNSKLVYEEDKPDANGPGKVFFTNFNMNVRNINSNKRKGADTKVPITINCRFMDASPMKVNWNFDTANLRDQFTIAGSISNLPASDINPFIKPYMNITATGLITGLNFDFRGNNDVMTGKFRMTHQDLKVNILDKDTKKKKGLLSAVANLVVKKDSEKFPESVDIEVERSKDRSFFNFYWKGIEDGLKKSLLVIKL